MRLTRRGKAVVAVALLAVVSGLAFGPRSLNAVVVPAITASVSASIASNTAVVSNSLEANT